MMKNAFHFIFLFHISRCKSNQMMKLGQLIEHNWRNIFIQKYVENETRTLVLFF